MTLAPAIIDQVRAFIAADFKHETEFLAGLVRVPSDNPPGDCQAHARRAQEQLLALGFKVEAHAVPQALTAAAGMITATNLIVRQQFGEGGPTIALNAHGDVVPPGRGWTRDPYGAEIVEDPIHGAVMYGRGVAVSKSDFATYTWAVLALQRLASSGLVLNGAVELHLTYDEEIGGTIGPGWLIEHKLTQPDYVLSAGFSYKVTTAHNGCLHLEVTVNGKSGHAAMPDTGIDALDAATQVLNALYAYRSKLATTKSSVPGIDTATLNVGLISGGINTNVVPDRVTLRLDRRIIPEENVDAAEADLRRVITAAVAGRKGISVDIKRVLLAQPLVQLPAATPLIEALQTYGQLLFDTRIEVGGVPLYTDARHYSNAGIPTVLYGAGPRTLQEANGHMADENLRLDDLQRATVVVALTLADLLSG
jgi:acetylornithine deacetylase/succinyl-diaminopimelate desuccinylase-like protein